MKLKHVVPKIKKSELLQRATKRNRNRFFCMIRRGDKPTVTRTTRPVDGLVDNGPKFS